MPPSSICKMLTAPPKKKKMSKAAYRAQVLGMWTKFARTVLFNLFVFVLGSSIGMGFTIVNVQRAFREKYASDTVVRLERALMQHGWTNEEIGSLLTELRCHLQKTKHRAVDAEKAMR